MTRRSASNVSKTSTPRPSTNSQHTKSTPAVSYKPSESAKRYQEASTPVSEVKNHSNASSSNSKNVVSKVSSGFSAAANNLQKNI